MQNGLSFKIKTNILRAGKAGAFFSGGITPPLSDRPQYCAKKLVGEVTIIIYFLHTNFHNTFSQFVQKP